MVALSFRNIFRSIFGALWRSTLGTSQDFYPPTFLQTPICLVREWGCFLLAPCVLSCIPLGGGKSAGGKLCCLKRSVKCGRTACISNNPSIITFTRLTSSFTHEFSLT